MQLAFDHRLSEFCTTVCIPRYPPASHFFHVELGYSNGRKLLSCPFKIMGSPSESPHITLFEPRCEEQLEAADSNSSPWPPAHTSENTVAFEESPSETSHSITPAPEVKDSDSSTVSPKMEPSRSGPSTIEEVQPKLSDDGLKACLALDSREGKSKLLRQEILRVEEEGTLEDPNTNTWQPFFLRKSTLWGLMSLFISQILTLITLFSYSSHNGGIVPVAARYHQAWKYGPNASQSDSNMAL